MIEKYDYSQSNKLSFHILQSHTSAFDELAFIHVLEMLYSGTVNCEKSFTTTDQDESQIFLHVELIFDEFHKFDAARSDCNSNIQNMALTAKAVARVNRVDRERRMAKRIFDKAIKAT